MNDRTNRDALQWQSIAWLDGSILTALTVCVLDQRNMCAAIRIVFEPLDDARNSVFIAFEIYDPVMLLMAATMVTNRDASVVVTTACL